MHRLALYIETGLEAIKPNPTARCKLTALSSVVRRKSNNREPAHLTEPAAQKRFSKVGFILQHEGHHQGSRRATIMVTRLRVLKGFWFMLAVVELLLLASVGTFIWRPQKVG